MFWVVSFFVFHKRRFRARRVFDSGEPVQPGTRQNVIFRPQVTAT
jgi:hypothetical protein